MTDKRPKLPDVLEVLLIAAILCGLFALATRALGWW
jgi:hypothetical protein